MTPKAPESDLDPVPNHTRLLWQISVPFRVLGSVTLDCTLRAKALGLHGSSSLQLLSCFQQVKTEEDSQFLTLVQTC